MVAASELVYQPEEVFPAGTTLAEWLQRRGMSQVEFARRAGLTPKHVNQVLAGSAGITPEVATNFDSVTGIPARYWSQLEANYRAWQQLIDQEEELAGHLSMLDAFPVQELIRRGVLPQAKTRAAQLRELLRFFGVATVSALREVWLKPTAHRKSRAFPSDRGAVVAWLRIAEMEAELVQTASFDARRSRALARELRLLTGKPFADVSDRLRRVCADTGIAVVTVKELHRCRINGAARWMSPDKAMIALSLRHRRNDIFWFTFFHELGHLVKHSKKETFVDLPTDGSDGAEQEADRFAARALIPAEYEDRLFALRGEAEIRALAKEIGVAPGIVLGRLQHEGLVPHRALHNLFVPYKYADET